MVSNGYLSSAQLTQVQSGISLSTVTARAWKRMVAAASKKGWHISIAKPAGGYRSISTQSAMHFAGSLAGTRAQRIHWGLNPNSIVSIAQPGYSTHGTGSRVDIVGVSITATFLKFARTYGFTREFGSADPNHFVHDGKTATYLVVPNAKVYYTIRKDDTLSKVARDYKTTVAKIASLSGIKNVNLVGVGQRVRVK